MPAPSNSERITGETRYRTGWFGKLIVQVEENYTQYYAASHANPARMTSTRWRDARASDLYLIGWHQREAQAKADGLPPPPPPEQYASLNGRPRVRGGYQPTTGSAAPKVTPTGGSAGRKRQA